MDWIAKYWLEAVFGVVCAALGVAYKRLAKRVRTQREESRAIKEGLLAILHNDLYRECKMYLAQGHIDTDGLDNIRYLYTSYHTLGGNGTGTALYERCCKLDIRED